MCAKKEVSYKRLDLTKRTIIQNGLDDKLSLSQIANHAGVSVSSVKREVDRYTIVARSVTHANAGAFEIRKEMAQLSIHCSRLQKTPMLCNGCRRVSNSICKRTRHLYRARIADQLASTKRRESRCGIDLSEDEATQQFELIRNGLAQGLSPAVIANTVEGVKVSESTIYRWCEKGYGGLKNIDLPKKVRYRPRKHTVQRPHKVVHDHKRLFEAFLELDEDRQLNRWEMDTVVGRQGIDSKCFLTLLHKPSHFQMAILVKDRSADCITQAIAKLSLALGDKIMDKLFDCVLTDNGKEFSQEEDLAALFVERGDATRLFFCDPAHSEQKGSCEKNHVEIRKLIPKGKTIFDALDDIDAITIMTQVNSLPRESLMWKTPFEVFRFYFEEAADKLFKYLSIEPTKDLHLTENYLNEMHTKRGLGLVVMS